MMLYITERGQEVEFSTDGCVKKLSLCIIGLSDFTELGHINTAPRYVACTQQANRLI